jgi:hypothetical protein
MILAPFIIFRTRRISDKAVNVDFLSLFQIPLPININFPLRGIYLKWLLFFITLIIAIFYYLNLNFASFFPQKLEMTVHFNERIGINKLVQELEVDEINGLKINYDTLEITNFFNQSDLIIKKYLNYKNYYSTAIMQNNDMLETTGITTFVVEKVGGIQNYQIVSAEGEVRHRKKIKGTETEEKLTTKFQKVISQNDKISVNSLSQLFNKIIIAPKFSQSLVINGKGNELLEEYLYGVTIIKTLPYPKFTSTLYFVLKGDVLIPIGYAEYYQKND